MDRFGGNGELYALVLRLAKKVEDHDAEIKRLTTLVTGIHTTVKLILKILEHMEDEES